MSRDVEHVLVPSLFFRHLGVDLSLNDHRPTGACQGGGVRAQVGTCRGRRPCHATSCPTTHPATRRPSPLLLLLQSAKVSRPTPPCGGNCLVPRRHPCGEARLLCPTACAPSILRSCLLPTWPPMPETASHPGARRDRNCTVAQYGACQLPTPCSGALSSGAPAPSGPRVHAPPTTAALRGKPNTLLG